VKNKPLLRQNKAEIPFNAYLPTLYEKNLPLSERSKEGFFMKKIKILHQES
jgi:hypothetical protein